MLEQAPPLSSPANPVPTIENPVETVAFSSSPLTPPPKPKYPKFIFVLVIAGLFLLATGVYALMNPKAPAENTLQTSPSPSLEPSLTPSPGVEVSPTLIPSTTMKKNTSPTPKPTVKPSPSPKLINIRVPGASIVRMYNDGTSAGWQNERNYSGDTPTLQRIKYTMNYVDVCFTLNPTEEVPVANLTLSLRADGQPATPDSTPAKENYHSNVIFPVCKRFSNPSLGIHTVNLQLVGSNIQVNDATPAPLIQQFIIAPDTVAPTFTIFGPHQETEGTCAHLNDIADNIFSYSDLTISQKMDDGSWTTDKSVGRLCVQGASGSSHTYYAKISDPDGNTTEKNLSFTIP